MRKWHYAAVGAIVLVLAAVLIMVITEGRGKTVNRDTATWVWDLNALLDGDEANVPRVADFMRERQVRTVYLHVGTAISGEEEGLYRAFNRAASAEGIEVQALGGERNWALPEGRAGMREFLGMVSDYNAAVPEPERFAGVHLDVEPYSLPIWDEDREGTIRGWRTTVEEMSDFARAHALRSGVDIPFWLDEIPAFGGDSGSGEASGTSETSRNSGSGGGDASETLDQWMMRSADSVTLMSYRNEAEGSGGVIDLVKQEIDHARGTGAVVLVGLNVAKDTEPKLTFRGLGADRFRDAVSRIQRAYAGNAGFGGIAVHDLAAWMQLEGADIKAAD